MQRNRRVPHCFSLAIYAFAVGAVVIAGAFVSPPAAAARPIPNLVGHFAGRFCYSDGSEEAVEVNVASQRRRRFSGVLVMAVGACPLNGTVAASGRVNMIGRGPGFNVVMRGRLGPDGNSVSGSFIIDDGSEPNPSGTFGLARE